MLVVDTGVLLAAADDADSDHRVCVDLVETTAEVLVTSPLVVAETGYLIERQLGPEAEAGFYRSIAAGDLLVEVLTATDYRRIAELIERYADLGLGGTDASLVVIAERLGRVVSPRWTIGTSVWSDRAMSMRSSCCRSR